MKGTVIFADQNKEEEKPEMPRRSLHQKDPKVILSRDEYREVVKEAYKEGVKDALSEQKHSTPVTQHPGSEKEGEKAAVKKEAQKKEETKQKLESLAKRQDIELLRAKTVFPITIFPDTIIIDTTKLTIIRKQFFATEHITTIPLKDLADAQVQTALLFASLTVSYMPQSNSPGMLRPVEDHITGLRRADAMRAKNILKGALVANAEGIDVSNLSPEEVVNVIEKFGENAGVT